MLSAREDSRPTLQQRKDTASKDYAELSTNNHAFDSNYPPIEGEAGFPGKKADFHWIATSDEPHKSRRKLILQKYPQIKNLFGVCHKTKYSVAVLVTAQFLIAYYLQDKMWSMQFWAIAYVLGGTINHALFLAIHEITHFLAFKKPIYNRYLAMVANLPIGFPYCAAFRDYHTEHHTSQGIDGIDTDLPTKMEGLLLNSFAGKLFFCTFQILFYALRPGLVRLQKFSQWHALNWAFQISVMSAMIYTFGMNPFYYFAISTFLSGSLHPMAGHFLAEHYVFVEGYETYSYYGWMNILGFNVGYHNEHHDFPLIPGSRLPLVRKIAPEFYNDLPQVKSWPGTIYNFLTLPHMSSFSRVKRPLKLNKFE